MNYEKRYSEDWAKAKSRKIVKDMIANTLLTHNPPENLRVLCLPGIDAAEIHQVYDPLGIPRSNIVGVEWDAQIADTLESRSLGIRIVKGDVKDYIDSQKWLDFGVVSLDYTGPLSTRHLGTLQDIVAKQTQDEFLLHTVNLIRRDNLSMPLYHAGYSQISNKEGGKKKDLEGEVMEEAYRRAANWTEFGGKLAEGVKLLTEKRLSYSQIIRAMCQNSKEGDADKLLKFVLGSDYEEILSMLEKRYGVSMNRGNPYSSILKGDQPPTEFLLDMVTNMGIIHLAKILGMKEERQQAALKMILREAVQSQKYFIELESATYSYISETGTPMIGSVNFLAHPTRTRNVARDIGRQIGLGEGQAKKPWSQESFDASLQRYLDRLSDNYPQERIERLKKSQLEVQFLGSSSKPVLTKGRAIQEFREGATVRDLMERYRAWKGKPLAQWKAHVTMGSYDERSEGRFDSSDESLEKISKEEAIDLLSSNIPVGEIHDAYPSSFTKEQLRAFKAHITMGTYKGIEGSSNDIVE